MFTQDQLREVIGSTAYDSDGDKIGTVGNVYYDDETDQPKWLTVNTGFFGTNESFVPVQAADLAGDGRVTVTYDKAMVKDAPNVNEDGHLSVEDEQQALQLLRARQHHHQRHYRHGQGRGPNRAARRGRYPRPSGARRRRRAGRRA